MINNMNPVAQWMELMMFLFINGSIAVFVLLTCSFLWHYKEEMWKIMFVILFISWLAITVIYFYDKYLN